MIQDAANKILYSILEKSYIMNNKYNFRYCYFNVVFDYDDTQ